MRLITFRCGGVVNVIFYSSLICKNKWELRLTIREKKFRPFVLQRVMYVHDAFRYSGIVNIASKGFVLDAC